MELSPPWHGVFGRGSIRASSIRNRKILSGYANRVGAVIGTDYVACGNQLDEIQWSLKIKYHRQTRLKLFENMRLLEKTICE